MEAQKYAAAFAAIVTPGLLETKLEPGGDARAYFRARLESYLASAFDEGKRSR